MESTRTGGERLWYSWQVSFDSSTQRKTALVTGGTSGVGLSVVRALVDAGTFVHFIGRRESQGRSVEEGLNGETRIVCRFIKLDLGDLRAVRDFARGFATDVARLDVLANVAGVMLADRQETADGIEKTLAINHLAAFLLCEELAPLIAKAPHGRIVNVSGAPSIILKPRLDFENLQLANNYSLMRAATNSVHAKTVMTEILSERYAADGIDVNAFHPGAVKSDLWRDARFPMNILLGFGRLFMSATSDTATYVSTSDDLNGVTGQLFVGTKPRELRFEQAYKDRLLSATEELVATALKASPP